MSVKKPKKNKLAFHTFLYPECLRVPLDVKSKGEAIWELIQTLHYAKCNVKGGNLCHIPA